MQLMATNYVINLFADNNEVTPDVKFIGPCMTHLSAYGLIPSFGNEINGLTGERKNFLRMVSANEELQINFQSQTTTIVMVVKSHLEEFPPVLTGILQNLNVIFPSKKCNRLSVITSTLFNGTVQEYDKVWKEVYVSSPEDSAPFEWDARQAFKINLEGVEDNMNLVSTVRRGSLNIPNGNVQDSVVIDTDLNTEFENSTRRFTYIDAIPNLERMLLNNTFVTKQTMEKLGV